jgi:hypothetical protein
MFSSRARGDSCGRGTGRADMVLERRERDGERSLVGLSSCQTRRERVRTKTDGKISLVYVLFAFYHRKRD